MVTKQNCVIMETSNFMVSIKTYNIYKDIVEDVETRFGTSNCELDRQLPKGRHKKVIRLMKDELGGTIMKKFVGLRAKTYSFLIDENKEAKLRKKCLIKRKLKFEDYKNCLEATQLENKIIYPQKNETDGDNLKRIIKDSYKTIN